MPAIATGVAPTCLISVCLKAEGHRIDVAPGHQMAPNA
jgi:hypothetical protein